MPGLVASINPGIDVGGAAKIFDFAWLFGVSLFSGPILVIKAGIVCSPCWFLQFFVALVVYSTLSLCFPAKETYIPEAITSEDAVVKNVDGSTQSEKSSQHDKEIAEGDLKPV